MKSPALVSRRDLATMLIIGATTGAVVACVFVAGKYATDPGDILGFFGGAIGAGLAVVGALWLDARKLSAKVETDKRLLTQSLIQVALAAESFNITKDDNSQVVSRLLTLRQAILTFNIIRISITVDDALAYFTMSSLIYWFDIVDTEIRQLLELFDLQKKTVNDVRSSIEKRLAVLPISVATILESHPYWGEAKTDLEHLLVVMRANLKNEQVKAKP